MYNMYIDMCNITCSPEEPLGAGVLENLSEILEANISMNTSNIVNKE